jgi:hypothetical protein
VSGLPCGWIDIDTGATDLPQIGHYLRVTRSAAIDPLIGHERDSGPYLPPHVALKNSRFWMSPLSNT